MVAEAKQAQVCLGKLPPKQYYQQVGVKLKDFASPKALASAPPLWAYGSHIYYTMMLNDQLGDCTCASAGHGEHTWSTRTKHKEVPSDQIILEMYSRTGARQGLSNDDGRWMAGNGVGVLDIWKNEGMMQADGSLEKIDGYAAVDYTNKSEVTAAGYWFGGLSIGIALPEAAAYQWVEAQQRGVRTIWSTSRRLHDGSTNPGSWTPGTWGGHEIWVTSINKIGPVAVSWAQRVQMTWAWWMQYLDEAYAILSPDWINHLTMQSPSGLDLIALRDELSSIH